MAIGNSNRMHREVEAAIVTSSLIGNEIVYGAQVKLQR